MLNLPTTIAALPSCVQERVIRSMPETLLRDWAAAFPAWAHDGQVAPAGDWRSWVILGGRGFGKTRAGAEWVLGEVRAWGAGARPVTEVNSVTSDGIGRADPPAVLARVSRARPAAALRIALVGATIEEARAVMVEGPSGLLACARAGEVVRWSAAERRVVFSCGAEAALFSARSPQGLRGPEHDIAWADELGKWPHAQAAWDMLQLGLRRGARPRAVVTTTPSAERALARLLAAADTVATGGATQANPHLPAAFLDAVERAYRGSRLYAQEVEGVLSPDREGSLWPTALIAARRGSPLTPGDCVRVVVGVDPPASAGGTCGIVVAGLDAGGLGWVLDDRSAGGCSPEAWGRRVAAAARDWGADRVIAEANQGGDMVRHVLRGADAGLAVAPVHARRGKYVRAEPVAALFERNEAGLAGVFPALEAELGAFVAGGYAGEASPDRADAMVWALWALMLGGRGEPGVRRP